MFPKQKIVRVNKYYFEDLITDIQKVINENERTMEVQQINYFNVENNIGDCSAMILFKEKIKTEPIL